MHVSSNQRICPYLASSCRCLPVLPACSCLSAPACLLLPACSCLPSPACLFLPACSCLPVRQAVEYETTLANITELEEALALAQEQVWVGSSLSYGRAGGGGALGRCRMCMR